MPTPKRKQKCEVWIINDEEVDGQFLQEILLEAFPPLHIRRFEDAFTASKSAGSPDVIIIDISAVGSILIGPRSCYSGICHIADRHPGAAIVINSAVSSYFAADVLELVKENCPDSIVHLVDWSRGNSVDSLLSIMRELNAHA